MSEIPKAYEPQAVEEKWYDFWLKQGCFTADPARVSEKRPAYSIVIPPPNVTGVLHMGHILNNTLQDILARKARMDGKEVLWLPGTDHAGIATQTVVERTLKKQGVIKHRNDLGREKFLEKVWEWKAQSGGIIIQQLKKLGASCDWTRERFTMDPEYSRCVTRVFVDLYRKGLIYRGKRMVNWCPASQTALSDEEVIMKEQKGSLYYFKVEIAEEPGTFLTIATTRPETIPADTAVAVNPKDPRYAGFVGKQVLRAIPANVPREQRLIPIIADEKVDFTFGTGVLKVTPAHDRVDFEIGQRHGLPVIEAINADGTMSAAAGSDLAGLDRLKARKLAVELLTGLNAMEKEEPHTNNVGFSERADVPIEPRLSEQWFLKYPSLEKSRACVDQGDATESRPNSSGGMRFYPQRWAKVYDHWLGGIQDWCISRQLWWGHRIPVWSIDVTEPQLMKEFADVTAAAIQARQQRTTHNLPIEISFSGKTGESSAVRIILVADSPNSTDRIHKIEATTISDAEAEALERRGFTHDPDVLDTWFSSWLWPFATMGWPEKTEALKAFYPTSDLVTGPDIIFFWVARMIMAGYEYMGDLPFRNVYFTGIIRDKQGRKMSKMLGNSPDPLDLIGRFGADALRFGTMRSAPLGSDVLFDEKDVELGRNFCNKLWNACRFRQMQGGEAEGEINPALLTSDDKWILLRLDQAIREINQAFVEYRFNDATTTLYRFFWSEYCDWYVEASKAALTNLGRTPGNETQPAAGAEPAASSPELRANKLAVIDFVLGHALRLFHPFLPFITEELWHGMGYAADLPGDQGGKTIMFARWPKPLNDDEKAFYGLDETAEKVAVAKYELVSQGRNLRRELKLDPAKKLKFILKPAGDLPAAEVEVLRLLLNAETIEVNPAYVPPKGTPSAGNALGEIHLPRTGLVDDTVERARLEKDREKYLAEIGKVEQKLANQDFVARVPAAVLEDHKKRLADWQTKLRQVETALKDLS